MSKSKMKKVGDYLQEQLKDPQFKVLWKLEEQKLKIVKRIIAYRIKHNLTQRQLAKEVGVSRHRLFHIEDGSFGDMTELDQILRHIGYTIKIRIVTLRNKTKNKTK